MSGANEVEVATAKKAIPPNVPQGRDYELPGQQVEPTSAFWLTGHQFCVPRLEQVTSYTEPKSGGDERFKLDFEADFPTTKERLDSELKILQGLADARGTFPYPNKVGGFQVTDRSRFLNLQPVPFGSIIDIISHAQVPIGRGEVTEQHRRITEHPPIIDQGQELARLFESETPGLLHRQALNWLFFGRADVSPPRQARIWLALDMAIYTALSAGWHYKWVREPYYRLLRPKEYAIRTKQNLSVLFDDKVSPDGREKSPDKKQPDATPRTCPMPSPGTPRHPAWPSGHSTYSAAASYLLEYIFSPGTLKETDAHLFSNLPNPNDIENPRWIAVELRRLRNNIGEARLWAGVHWISDHIAGQKVGRAAAQAVIDNLEADCTVPFTLPPKCDNTKLPNPPSREDLSKTGPASRTGCSGNHDEIKPNPMRGEQLLLEFGTF